MKKSVLVFVVAAALVSGCSDDKSAPAGNELIKLKSVAYTVEASTRAPFEKAIGADNELKAYVATSVTAGDYATPHAKGTLTFKDLNLAAAYNADVIGSPSFPEGTDVVYAFGVYPDTGWTLNATSLSGYTFDGKTDVLGANEVTVDKIAVNSDNAPTLEFNHLLTKLSVKFVGEADVVTTLGTIKSVELVTDEDETANVNNEVSFASTDATTFAPSATAGTKALPFYKAAGGVYTDDVYDNANYTLTGTPTLQAYALVAPVVVTAAPDEKAYTLKVVRSRNGNATTPQYVSFDLKKQDGSEFDEPSTAGYAFTVTILYTQAGIVRAEAEVADWKPGGESHGGIKAPAND
jgi:hypothetical protein